MTARRIATGRVPQRDQVWLESATPEQVTAALDAGELAELLGAPESGLPTETVWDGVQWSRADLDGATPEQIDDALRAGELQRVLAGEPPPDQWSIEDFNTATDTERDAAWFAGALSDLAEAADDAKE